MGCKYKSTLYLWHKDTIDNDVYSGGAKRGRPPGAKNKPKPEPQINPSVDILDEPNSTEILEIKTV